MFTAVLVIANLCYNTSMKTKNNKGETTMQICDEYDICDIVQKAAELAEADGEFFDMTYPQPTERDYLRRAMREIRELREQQQRQRHLKALEADDPA